MTGPGQPFAPAPVETIVIPPGTPGYLFGVPYDPNTQRLVIMPFAFSATTSGSQLVDEPWPGGVTFLNVFTCLAQISGPGNPVVTVVGGFGLMDTTLRVFVERSSPAPLPSVISGFAIGGVPL